MECTAERGRLWQRTVHFPSTLASLFSASSLNIVPNVAAYESVLRTLRPAVLAELYLLTDGCYPEPSSQLVPVYLDRFPVDPIDGCPLHYQVAGNRLRTYSIARNQIDDNGKALEDLSASLLNQPDWTWPSCLKQAACVETQQREG